MKIVFFGTSPFSIAILDHLLQAHQNVLAAVTKADQPQGRSLRPSSPPLKQWAEQYVPSMPLYQPEKASDPKFIEQMRQLNPDVFVVAAYGQILRPQLLDIPRLMPINVHASLLPKWRGAAPIHRCLMAGEPVTGITIMKMVQALDAGDMLDACSMSIPVDMNHAELESQLAKISKEPLLRVLERLEKGGLKTIKQDDSQATFAPKITSSEIEIDWNRPAWDVHNQIRALSPYPGAWTWIEWGGERKKMKIKKTVLEKGHTALPKQNIILDKTNWVVSCLQDHLRILEVQIEGKKVLPIDQFLRGLQTPLSVL